MIEVELELSDQHRQVLLAHVESQLPNEACALLIGRGDKVVELIPARNVDKSPTSYTIEPADLLAAYDYCESKGLEVIGVAHSHPNGPATPSKRDIKHALSREWVYLIVGSDGEIRCWKVQS